VTDEWCQIVLETFEVFSNNSGLSRRRHRRGFPYANVLGSRLFYRVRRWCP
jgi:hypothetical protein